MRPPNPAYGVRFHRAWKEADMDRTAAGIAVLALAVGGAGLWAGLDARERASSAEAAAAASRAALAAAEGRIEEARRSAESAEAGRRSAEERLGALEAGVVSLAAGGTGPAGPPSSPAGGTAPSPSPGPAGKAPVDPARVAEFKGLRDRYFKGDLDDVEEGRFWEMAKSEGFLDAVIGEMEAAVAASPEDVGARMELSRDYIARLFTVPPGPEMGLWASKAETQWKEVLARDDRHWEARMSLATSWARYPDFLNKTPDAIREFETLRRQQEAGPLEERQAQVYMELGNLYKRAGNPEKQRAALEDGLRRHPEDESLRKALEVLNPR